MKSGDTRNSLAVEGLYPTALSVIRRTQANLRALGFFFCQTATTVRTSGRLALPATLTPGFQCIIPALASLEATDGCGRRFQNLGSGMLRAGHALQYVPTGGWRNVRGAGLHRLQQEHHARARISCRCEGIRRRLEHFEPDWVAQAAENGEKEIFRRRQP